MSDDDARVLWVLSDAQRVEYRKEIEGTRHPRAKFVYRSSPEQALEEVSDLAPRVVVVGMTNEEMDGLEFLALLMRPKLGFTGKAIVLPDRGDPYPPVMQWRDAESGRSVTEELTVDELPSRIRHIVDPVPSSTTSSSTTSSSTASVDAAASAPEASADAVPAGLFGTPGAAEARAQASAKPAPVKLSKPSSSTPAASKPATSKPVSSPAAPKAPLTQLEPLAPRTPKPDLRAFEPPTGLDAPTVRPPPSYKPFAERTADSGARTLPPPSDGPAIEELLAQTLAEVMARGPAGAPEGEPPEPEHPQDEMSDRDAPAIAEESVEESVATAPTEEPAPTPASAVAAPHPIAAAATPSPISAQASTSATAAPAPRASSARLLAVAVVLVLLATAGLLALRMVAAPDPEPAPGQRATDSEPSRETPSEDVPSETPPESGPGSTEPAEAAPPPSASLGATTLPLYFSTGVAHFRVEDEARMDEIVESLRTALQADADAVVEVGGHTSVHGSDEVNQLIGRRRAEAVRDYLVEHGVRLERIVIRNYYSSHPVQSAPGDDDRDNRRVTVRIID